VTAGHPQALSSGDSGCPDAEQLAGYLDGTLDAGPHDAIELHMADCARCRFAVAEAATFITKETITSSSPVAPPRVITFPRSGWRAGAVTALAAAAALTIVARVAPQWLPWGPDRTNQRQLQELIAAVAKEPNRPVEGRLTGGFPYGPPPSVTRGSAVDVSPAVRVAAARIEKLAEAEDTAVNLAALGVAYLVTREYDKAVGALENAVQRDPSNARFLTDLSAAYLARARWLNKADDWPKALAAADRAVSHAPAMPEAYFNRALALDALHGDADAQRAWAEYRAMDSAGKWSEEASTRAARKSGANPDVSTENPSSQ
jgi:tetratricopeptide (TPR) repeat protein